MQGGTDPGRKRRGAGRGWMRWSEGGVWVDADEAVEWALGGESSPDYNNNNNNNKGVEWKMKFTNYNISPTPTNPN